MESGEKVLISVQVELENFADRYLCMKNKISEQEVKKYVTTAFVDAGALMLMLPRDIVEELNLRILRKAIVFFADDRKDELDIAGTVTIKIGKRLINTDCAVGSAASKPLIGRRILRELDLVADYQRRILTPRLSYPTYPPGMML